MTTKHLENLVNNIENLDSKHHIEILRIIKHEQPGIRITENNNGCFINMNEINDEILKKIEQYLEFNSNKEKELKEHETIKNNIIENFIN